MWARVLVRTRTRTRTRARFGYGKAEPLPRTVAAMNSPSVDSATVESLAALARYTWEFVCWLVCWLGVGVLMVSGYISGLWIGC